MILKAALKYWILTGISITEITNSMAYGIQSFCLIHKGPPVIPIPSWIPHIYTYFFKIHSNIILPSTPRSS
jgi:hypothetical protein